MKSLNPSHPDCECEQCQEMFRRSQKFDLIREELRLPYIAAMNIFEESLDRWYSVFKTGTTPSPELLRELAEAKDKRDKAWEIYQKNVQEVYEQYPIAHHA